MMSGMLARRVFPMCSMSRDPVTRWLGLLRTFQHCALFQSSTNNAALCIHPCKQLHVSCVKLKMRKQELDERKKFSKNVKMAYLKANMTVTELANKLSVPLDDVVTSLLLITEEEYQPDQEVEDAHAIEKVATMLKRNFKMVIVKKASTDTTETQIEEKEIEQKENQDIEKQDPADPEKLIKRAPVVTIMGHVDHGKTTLLDALRESRVVDMEFGGITQHIGAFNVMLPSGHSITFLDTPGHAAFSAMRARGASVTDIVVLVIAAEDGIMPQTIESIRHAQASNVPLIVAINKIDKHGVNIDQIKILLAVHGVVVEEHGGDVQTVPISALKRINLDKLEECITTLAEYLELKGDPVGLVEGHVIETRTDPGKGKLATVLIQRGTLKRGDLLLAGTAWTKVRNMYDNSGKVMKNASLSMPVEVGGWRDLPHVGDEVLQVKTERRLKRALQYRLNKKNAEKDKKSFEIIKERRTEEREIYVQKRKEKLEYHKNQGVRFPNRTSIDRTEWLKGSELVPKTEEATSDRPKFNIILKADVAGSVEAILNTLATFRSKICDLDIMHSGVGDVTQYDIDLAKLFEGVIYAFNVGVSADTDPRKVNIKTHNVIYHLFDDLVETINYSLPDKTIEEIIGEAKILQEYIITAKRKERNVEAGVAGCKCTSGSLERKHLFRIVRGDEVIYDGDLTSLKQYKTEVNTVNTEQECGICFSTKKMVAFKTGDTVICYKKIVKTQTLDWEPGVLDNSFLTMNQN